MKSGVIATLIVFSLLIDNTFAYLCFGCGIEALKTPSCDRFDPGVAINYTLFCDSASYKGCFAAKSETNSSQEFRGCWPKNNDPDRFGEIGYCDRVNNPLIGQVHVCVCRGDYCNDRSQASRSLFETVQTLVWFVSAIQLFRCYNYDRLVGTV